MDRLKKTDLKYDNIKAVDNGGFRILNDEMMQI